MNNSYFNSKHCSGECTAFVFWVLRPRGDSLIVTPIFSATALDKLGTVIVIGTYTYFVDIKTEMRTFAKVFGPEWLPSCPQTVIQAQLGPRHMSPLQITSPNRKMSDRCSLYHQSFHHSNQQKLHTSKLQRCQQIAN